MCDKCDKLPVYAIEDIYSNDEKMLFIHYDKAKNIDFYERLKLRKKTNELEIEDITLDSDEYTDYMEYAVTWKMYKDERNNKFYMQYDNSNDEYTAKEIEITHCPFCGKELK